MPPPKNKPLTEYLLSTVDGLYLPLGYWHNVEAVSDISMHVTIGLDFARRLDVLGLIAEELARDSLFRDKVDCSMTNVEAHELKERLVESIRLLDMEVFLAKLYARRIDKGPFFNFPSF